MAVEAGDIKVRLSTQSGSAGNSVASTPAASIGKFMSTTELVDASVENLFPNITAAQAGAGVTLYRCLFLYNSHATSTWLGAKVWIESQTAGGGEVSIGLDPAGAVANNSGSAQAAAPADEETAPVGVTFSAPTTIDDALVIGDLAAGECAAVWLRMVVAPDTAAQNLDSVVIRRYGTSDP